MFFDGRTPALLLSIFFCFASASSFADQTTTIKDDHVPAYAEPEVGAKLVGYLKRGTIVTLISKSDDRRFTQIAVSKKDGSTTNVYVVSSALENRRAERSEDRAESKEDIESDSDHDGHESIDHWSFGAGLSGYSTAGTTQMTISGDVRYLWVKWTESIVGLDLSFGSQTFVGGKIAQRLYGAFGGPFVPFLQLGYRMSKFSDFHSSAIEPGAGFQFLRRGGSYFEFVVTYLDVKPFNSEGPNVWIFGGSSGFRF